MLLKWLISSNLFGRRDFLPDLTGGCYLNLITRDFKSRQSKHTCVSLTLENTAQRIIFATEALNLLSS